MSLWSLSLALQSTTVASAHGTARDSYNLNLILRRQTSFSSRAWYRSMSLIFSFADFIRKELRSLVRASEAVARVRRSASITECFANVTGICEQSHIFSLHRILTTRHHIRGHNEY